MKKLLILLLVAVAAASTAPTFAQGKRIEVIDNFLVVTDTTTSAVEFERPKSSVRPEVATDGRIYFFPLFADDRRAEFIYRIDPSYLVDDSDTPYDLASIRTFLYAETGFNPGGSSSLPTGTVSEDGYSITWDNTASEYVLTDVSGGGGSVSVSGTPVTNDYAQFTNASTVRGRSYAEVVADLSLEVGTDVQAYDADLTTYAGITPSANIQSLLGSANYAAMRTLLDLEAGTDFYSISAANAAFQPLDADLTTYAVITPSANVQSLLGSADYAAMKVLLDLEIGTDVLAYDADVLFADATDELTVGYSASVYNGGTQSSGTYTPDESDGQKQRIVNGGAFTLAPPTNYTNVEILVTNNGSAGAITTSGFTIVVGDSFTTTDTNQFLCNISTTTDGSGTISVLNVIALQ